MALEPSLTSTASSTINAGDVFVSQIVDDIAAVQANLDEVEADLQDQIDALDSDVDTRISVAVKKTSVHAVRDLSCTVSNYSGSVPSNNYTALQAFFDGCTRNGVYNAELLLPPFEIFFSGDPLRTPQKVGGVTIRGIAPVGYTLGSQDFGGVNLGGQCAVLTRIDCSGTDHVEDEVLILQGAGVRLQDFELRGARMNVFGTLDTPASSCALLIEGRSSPSSGKHVIDGVKFSCAKVAIEASGYYADGVWSDSSDHADHTTYNNFHTYFVDTFFVCDNINSISHVFNHGILHNPLTSYGEVLAFDCRKGGNVRVNYLDFNTPHVCVCRWGYGGNPGNNWSQNNNRFYMADGRFDTPQMFYSTGTVVVSGGVATLTGGTWPSWASNAGGATLRIGNRRYKVRTRTSDTVLALYDTSASESSSAYSLAHCSLTLFRNGMAASDSYREVSVRIGMHLGHAAQDNNVVSSSIGPQYDPKYLVELGTTRVPDSGSSSLMPYTDIFFDVTNLPVTNYTTPHGKTWTNSGNGPWKTLV
jgi:hypothetical protein